MVGQIYKPIDTAAAGESRRCAISATIEWPSGPHARAGAIKAQLSAADSASVLCDVMRVLRLRMRVWQRWVTATRCIAKSDRAIIKMFGPRLLANNIGEQADDDFGSVQRQ
jgi:hypothetical protein